MIRKALLPSAHGEYPSALAELYYFSQYRWRRVFEHAGFRVQQATGHGLFYTGYGVCPGVGLGARQGMAKVLGSACNLFLLERRQVDRGPERKEQGGS